MDIVTHLLMGGILASPFLETRPLAATLFAFGAVLPDLDALSRAFGKRAFLVSHQTFTHAFPVIGAIGAATAVVLAAFGIEEALGAGVALALGMALHAVLDWTNTFGITLLAPFSSRRFCKEWVFFIDAVVIAATVPVIGVVGWRLANDVSPGWRLQAGYAGFLLLYWAARIALRRRAARMAPPGTISLLPSALVPWRYLGCTPQEGAVRVFEIDAVSGRLGNEERIAVLDGNWAEALARVPEVGIMRALSPAYHVVRIEPTAEGTRLYCRDLRTRNFRWTGFGAIDLDVDEEGTPRHVVFHV